MADNIIKLRVDSQEYDSKIKRAAQGLQALGQNLRSAGKTFADADKDAVKFAKELGNMQTVSNTAKGKIAEMSAAFVNLKSQYLQMTDAEKQSPIGQAMSKSLEELKQRTIDAKRELEDLNKELNGMKTTETSSGGGLFGGGKLDGMFQVFGGNLMTKAAGMAVGFASEIGDAVKQGIELAKAGEGIRIAFERLGRGDILDGLREATHGTVTDIELMKAAVKFNDFKLPVEELGTMLAFAQQKAKDTGQSVDYMVDSIVTGLGRKSLMILDNLGLSATEIRERMKETGDMTKAVGAIIRDQMAKAGDYVETAADRAAQANVSLQNKMEELGRKFAPVEEASNQLWTSMKIGILDVVGGPLARLLNGLTEAGRLKNMLNDLNGESGSGNTKVDQQLKKLNVIKKAGGSDYIFNSTLSGMLEDYNRQIMALDTQIKNGGKRPGAGSGESQDVRYLQRKMDALKIMRDQLAAGAKEINKPIKIESNIPDVTGGGRGKGGSTTTHKTIPEYIPLEGSIDAQTKKVQDLQKAWRAAADDTSRADIKKQIDEAQYALDKMLGNVKDRPKMETVDMKVIAPSGGIGSLIQDTFTRQQSGLTELKQKVKLELDTETLKTDSETLKTILKDSIKNGITGMDFKLMGLGDEIAKGINVQDETWQSILDQYNELREQIGLEPIKINFDTGNIENEGKKTEKSWQAASHAVQSVGSALQGLEDPSAKIAGLIGQAVANIALGFAQATSSDSKFGVLGWIAAIAGGLATMTSTISAIHSATGYAEGGIVKGNSYSGDNILATVGNSGSLVGLNAGELVLNRAQTAGLAQELEGVGSRQVTVHGVLRGKDIFIAAENWSKSAGRGEFVTW